MTIEYKDSKRITALSTDVILPTPETISGFTISGTSGKVSESSGTLSFTINSSGQSTLAVKALSANANSSYTLRYKLTITTDDISFSQAGNITSGTTSVTSGIGEDPPNSSYSIYLKHALHADVSANYSANGSSKDNDWGNGISNGSGARTKYVEIINNAGSITTRYTDSSDYTGGLVTPAWSAQSGAQSGAKGNIFFNFFSQNVSSGSIVGTISEIKLYNDASSSKPTNVQDNSLLVEKDTANRYWFDTTKLVFEDDFSSYASQSAADAVYPNNGNTSVGQVNITNDVIDATGNVSTVAGVVRDIGAVGSTFVLRFKIVITTASQYSSGAVSGKLNIGLFSTNEDGRSAEELIALDVNAFDNNYRFKAGGSVTPDAGGQTGAGGYTTETRYVEIKRKTDGDCVLSIFTTDAYTSSVLEGSKTLTPTGTITSALKYFGVKSGNSGSGNGTVVLTIDNVSFWNNTTVPLNATWTRELYFSDDFSSYADQTSANSAWVPASNVAGRRVNISDDDLDLLNDSGTTNYAVVHDLGANAVSDSKWTLRFSADVTLSSGSNNWCYIGLFNSDQSTGGGDSQNFVAIAFQNDGANTKFWGLAGVGRTVNSGQQEYFTATGNGTLTSTKYYIQIRRLTATSMDMKIYTDASYSTLHASMTISGSAISLGDLRYIKFANNTTSGSGSIAIVMDDVKFRNGSDTI